MTTECTGGQLEFQGLGRRKVLAVFDGGHISSDGGVLLLRETDEGLKLTERLAGCFTDHRNAERTEHRVVELLRQRIYALSLGYEDLNDHDDLMRDPLLALALGKRDPEGQSRRRSGDAGKALASSSTLNRLELTPAQAGAQDRYKKVVYHPERIEALFVDLFLDSFREAPEEVVLDFDATDDPIHGTQEGRFFHGYYRSYCYLPLYVTCGDHLLVAKLRTADRDGADGSTEVLAFLVERLRARWPETRIIVRGDSGFARDGLMAWCENNGVFYLLGLAKNKRLLGKLGKELEQSRALHEKTGQAARVFTHFHYRTLRSWTRSRRVIGKAEHLGKGTNPRFIVTNLAQDYATPKTLYERHYCARGDMENRIKEQQLDLFADRTSTHTMRANQLRLWFSSFAYVLLSAMRRVALKDTRLAKATCGSIRLKLLKIGAQVKISVRRFLIHLASACPYQDVFEHAWHNLQHYPMRC
ncbi:MAG: IS1380 family transposase [Candidatus Hydrogenedentes bacterium]|nr:IS1380 family transposase [Candidatus Hydrogenedentota bacterium]